MWKLWIITWKIKLPCFLNFVYFMTKRTKLPTNYPLIFFFQFLHSGAILLFGLIPNATLSTKWIFDQKKHLYLCTGIVLEGSHSLALCDIALLNLLTKQNHVSHVTPLTSISSFHLQTGFSCSWLEQPSQMLRICCV